MPLATADLVYHNTTADFDGKPPPGTIPLTSLEGDYNNFKLAAAVVALQTSLGSVGVGIGSITQNSPTTFIITLADDTVQGPFTIPTATWVDRGEWSPVTTYAVNDLFFESSTMGFYFVKFPHVSQGSFDAGQTDGLGNEYYGLALSLASSASVLRQATTKSETLTTHTLTSVDVGAFWNCTNAAGCAVTIPADSTYDAPIDTEVSFYQGTDEPVTFAATGPATFDPGDDNPATAQRGAVVTIKKIAANTWIGFGRFETVTA